MKGWPSLTMAQRMLKKSPSKDRVMHIAHDLLDNTSFPRVCSIERDDAGAHRMREHIRNDFVDEGTLHNILSRFSRPGFFLSHDVAGRKEERTAHGHRFVALSDAARVRILFLDPEHHVGERNLFRPSICNVIAIDIPRSARPAKDATLAVLRMKTTPSNAEMLDSFIELQRLALEFLDTGSTPSQFGTNDAQTSFILHSSPERSRISTRYTDQKNLRAYTEGGKAPAVIRTKAASFKHIVGKFLTRDFKERAVKNSPESDAA